MSAKDRFHLQGYLETAGEQNYSLFLILARKGFLLDATPSANALNVQLLVFRLTNKVLLKWKAKIYSCMAEKYNLIK